MLPVCLLTTRLATRPLNVSYVSRIIKKTWKNSYGRIVNYVPRKRCIYQQQNTVSTTPYIVKKNFSKDFFVRCCFHSPNWLSRIIHRKKTQKVGQKHTNGWYSSARWAAAESGAVPHTPSDPVPMLPTTRLATRPLNVSHVSRIIKQKI